MSTILHSVIIPVCSAILLMPTISWSSPATMKAPPLKALRPEISAHQSPESSVARDVFLGAINFYRKVISPISGTRCGFSPSCSLFGHQAIKEYGSVQGVMMTADRLTRCNIFKGPDADYAPLPNGKLFDPVSYNALRETR